MSDDQKKVDAIRWSDVTSYSRGERGKIEPRTYELNIDGWLVVITKHRDWGSEWCLRSRSAGIELERLGTTRLSEAKFKAIYRMVDRLMEISYEAGMKGSLLSRALRERGDPLTGLESLKRELKS